MSKLPLKMMHLLEHYDASRVECVINQKDKHICKGSTDGTFEECFQEYGLTPILQTMWDLELTSCAISADGIWIELTRKKNDFSVQQVWGGTDRINHSFAWSPKASIVDDSIPASNSTLQILQADIAMPLNNLSDERVIRKEPVVGQQPFCQRFGVKAPYVAGAMAGGIASVELVSAMSDGGYLSFFGAGGLSLSALEVALTKLQSNKGVWGCNLLHNPQEPYVEEKTVDMFLEYGVQIASASAYMKLTKALVRYRTAGIYEDDGVVFCPNAVFAKVSHPSVLQQFLQPPPQKFVQQLLLEGHLTQSQAQLCQRIPMAEEITIEGDSGGHTDRRPITSVFPVYFQMRNDAVKQFQYSRQILLGIAGGIGDPLGIRAARGMGADYVLLGSIHQCTVEAGTSNLVKEMLSQVSVIDCGMGIAPDMFEMGAQVQVLTKGTLYAQRSKKLQQLYKRYSSIDEIPEADRNRLEKSIFKKTLDEVWIETEEYWRVHPKQLERAGRDPKHKMALIFRWYLGNSSRWARQGTPDRVRDFQIWCGPSLGTFNNWAVSNGFSKWQDRNIVDVADALWSQVYLLERHTVQL